MNHRFVYQRVAICVGIGLAVLALLTAGQALAQNPAPAAPNGMNAPLGVNVPLGTSFTYQGVLKDTNGNPISDNCGFRFTLYDADVSGAQVGPIQDKTAVSVANGYFTVALDFGSGAFSGDARWLEVAVKCSRDADYTTLSPRQPLTPAPYALNADLLDGQHATAFASTDHNHWGQSWNGTGTGLTLSGGTTGLSGSGLTYGIYGTSSSASGTGVYGNAGATTGPTYGIYGESESTAGIGVKGSDYATSGYTSGVYGYSGSISGTGVYGNAGATSGTTYGVYGVSASTDGYGVYGYASATRGTNYGVRGISNSGEDGVGVYGANSATSGTIDGVMGVVHSPDGVGVYGSNSATSGWAYGVYGLSGSPDGVGVYGYNSATSGSNYGIYGQSSSSHGFGVYGNASATSGTTYGVYGTSSSTSGYGVYGNVYATSGNTYGVFGASLSGSGVYGVGPNGVVGISSSTGYAAVYGHNTVTSGTNYGIYGQVHASNADYGVYSYGNFGATGTKSAIVNTADYGWLHLYSMESPQVWFEDLDTAQLLNGVVVVTIDPIFAETVNLNQTYHVFLTPLGDCALYVSEKTTTSFTVRALGGQACSIAFDYRIIALRSGYEDKRLATAEDPGLIMHAAPPDNEQPGVAQP